MSTKWVNFYNKRNGKKLGGYTQKDSFAGELQATRALKAYEHKLDISDIEVRYEKQ